MKKVLLIVFVLAAVFLTGCDFNLNSDEMPTETNKSRVHFITSEESKQMLESGNLPLTGLYLVDMATEPADLDELLSEDGFVLQKDGTLLDENGDMATLFKTESIEPLNKVDSSNHTTNKGSHPLSGKVVYVRVIVDTYSTRGGFLNLTTYINTVLKVIPLTINSDNTKVLPIVCDHIIASISINGALTSQGGPNISSAINKRKNKLKSFNYTSVYHKYKVFEGDTVIFGIFRSDYTTSDFYHKYNGEIINNATPVEFAVPVP